MEIKFDNIILRDPKESDIDDEIRWNTTETEWALWDAPWEMEEWLPTFDPVKFRTEELEALKKPVRGFRWGMEVDTSGGVHVGSVNTYLIDESYEWIPLKNVEEDQRIFYTLGIEINEPAYWDQGIGTKALAAYIQYHLDNGHYDICLQTWSGNTRMVRCAKKLGFQICEREVGKRNVRGGLYDGLTFCLDVRRFHVRYPSPGIIFGPSPEETCL